MLHTAEDYKLPNGQIYHTYPSLKSAEDQKALWAGTLQRRHQLRRHRRAVLHACARRRMGKRIDDTTGGNSGVEPRLGVMYTEMVVRRGYSLRSYVDLVSTNAAKIMGLYPRKGAIAVGSDADIAILDPARRGKVRKEDLHETDYTPWEGHDIFAWPVVTILRGKVVVENGQFLGREGDGQYLKRKIAAEIIARAGAVSDAVPDACRGAAGAEPGGLARGGDVQREADGALLSRPATSGLRIARAAGRSAVPLDG